MTSTARQLMRTLATLAIAASTVSGVLYRATDAAYACHVDCGPALLHGHRAAVHTSRTHTRGHFPAHVRCALWEWRHPEVCVPKVPGQYRGKEVITVQAMLRYVRYALWVAISNSYGGSEFSSETSWDTHYTHPGIAITVSSGDSGYGAQYPAASPDVAAVGGTTLSKSGTGTYSETAWNGAGSGCSVNVTSRAWLARSPFTRRP